MSPSNDQIYSQPLEAITGFVFDQHVVRVFRDMIGRSVPGYATLISMLPVLAQHYVTSDSRCYDLGCSLGASTLALRHSIKQPQVEIMAVDNSPAMVEQCRSNIQNDSGQITVHIECADICQLSLQQASLVVMNFTLQFIPLQQRLDLLRNIYHGMLPGAALVLSEKLQFDANDQILMTNLHHTFKRLNGYSELEISQKRSALENVLISDTLATHQQRLQQAGFSRVVPWFQCFNFVSMLAIK